jgi:uncharacterized protein YbjT (DUF2867 family)
MNTANLQLEGLYLVIASLNNALVKKGMLSRDEIDLALRRAEETAIGDDRVAEDLRSSNRDAIAFPARLLALANRTASADEISTFSELARMVGSTKQPYNDQRWLKEWPRCVSSLSEPAAGPVGWSSKSWWRPATRLSPPFDLDLSTGPDFQAQFKGADAIAFAAGSGTGESSALDRTGLIKTARAAETVGVKRYLAIASIGASTGMKLSGEWNTEEMRDYYKQKRAGNKYLRESGLDWIILEPGELTDGKPTGKVTITEEALEEKSVDRADVAAVVVALLESKKSNKRAFQLTGGKTPIAEAVAKVLGEEAVKVEVKAPAKKAVAKKAPVKKAAAKK